MKISIGFLEKKHSFYSALLKEQLELEGFLSENILLFQEKEVFWREFCLKKFPIAFSFEEQMLTVHSWSQDWIFKLPFSLYRWKSVIQELKQEKFYTAAGLGIQSKSFIVQTPSGNRVTLSMKEHQLLLYLICGQDQPIPKEKIMQDVWGYEEGLETHTLETHLYDLRKKLEEMGPSFLKSKDGGYLLFSDERA